MSSDDCTDDACGYYRDGSCWSLRARRAAQRAHVVVTNYNLLFMHFRVREWTGRDAILPPSRVVVLDEGHRAADIARDCFGWDLGAGSIAWIGRMLEGGSDADVELDDARDEFFQALLDHRRSGEYRVRIRSAGVVPSGRIVAALGRAAAMYVRRLSSLVTGPRSSGACPRCP